MIAAREVAPADAFPKKDVSADEEALISAVKPDAAGGMPWQEEDIEPVITEGDGLAGGEEEQIAPVIFEGHSPLKSHCRRHCKDGLFFFVKMEG